MSFALVLFLIYFPVAVACYYSLGASLIPDNIVLAMSGGWQKVTVDVMLLLLLITTFPIIMNPPAQIHGGSMKENKHYAC